MVNKWHWIVVNMLTLACIALYLPAGHAQAEELRPLHIEVVPTVDRYPAGASYPLLFHVTVDEPWHVNSNQPHDEFLIPTTISLDPPEGMNVGRFSFPAPLLKKFEFSDTKLSIFEREFYVLSSITIPPSIQPGEFEARGTIEYQACNDSSCLPPQREPFKITMQVVAPGESYHTLNEALVSAAQVTPAESGGGGPSGGAFASGSLLITFLLVYLGGLALNLTPCVYPLIPITIGYFGGQSEGRKGRLLIHALLYVLGMSVTYSILGVFASLTGSMLGQALQNPAVLVFIALVMVILALSMFGLYEIRVPQFIARGAGQTKHGYFGTTFMGLTIGIIAAPCIGPFVLGLMTYVGKEGSPLLGFLMFFILAIGLGTPFLFLALFSGEINRLPRSGDWMTWVSKVFGFILLAMAVYFLSPLLSRTPLELIIIALAAVAGLYLGFLEGSGKGRPIFPWIKRAAGISVILAGIYFTFMANESARGLSWISYDENLLSDQRAAGVPAIIDFSADWCIPCKELEHYTFSDPRVVRLSKGLMMVKADLTSYQSPESVHLREKFHIKGVPTVIFLDRNGKERDELRFVGFISADAFLKKLEELGVESPRG